MAVTTKLNVEVADRGTVVVTAAFEDEDGNAVTPTSAEWTLTDGKGNVVNERDGVTLTPATSVEIVLSDADLAYADGDERHVVVDYVYDSDAGSGLRNTAQAHFPIQDVKHIE